MCHFDRKVQEMDSAELVRGWKTAGLGGPGHPAGEVLPRPAGTGRRAALLAGLPVSPLEMDGDPYTLSPSPWTWGGTQV